MNMIEDLRLTERLGDKQRFHKTIFEALLALWNGSRPAPQPEECAAYLPILARWLRAAPLKEPQDRFRILTARKSILSLVYATGTSVDEFLEMALGELAPLAETAPWVRQKLALMASIESSWTPDLDAWHRVDPAEAMTYALAGLQDEPLSTVGLDRFNAIATSLARLTPADLPYSYLADLSYANFIVSYATTRHKYDGKSVLGQQARRILGQRGFLTEMQPRTARVATERPRVAVIAEKIIGGNMMHRCYGQQISELKHSFDVTLFAEAPSRCAAHAEMANQVRYFDPHPEKLGALIRSVLDLVPDALYYPSVSMTPWTFALSHLRLAPLQVASLGHPSPTVSRVIDWQAIPRAVWSPDGATFEPPMLYDAHPLAADSCFSEAAQALHEARSQRPPRERIVVAVNASSMKLNADFLTIVRHIEQRCGGRLHLRFFPLGVGLRHLALTRRLQAWFPEAEIIAATDFDRYLGLIADCDLALQAFPFGGTNTTMDLLALGVPIVCLDGPEIHSRIDAAILHQSGLATGLLAKDADEYCEIAVGLIDKPAERLRIGRLARQRLLAVLGAPRIGTTFAAALSSLMRNNGAPDRLLAIRPPIRGVGK